MAPYVRYDPSSSQADLREGLQPLLPRFAHSFSGSLSRMRRAARGEGLGLRVRAIRLQRKLAQGVRSYVLAWPSPSSSPDSSSRCSRAATCAGACSVSSQVLGWGLLVTELISALSRRDEEERNRKLLEPARARVRAAFRVAEFSERAIDASAGGEVGNRYLDQFLMNSEALGFRGSPSTPCPPFAVSRRATPCGPGSSSSSVPSGSQATTRPPSANYRPTSSGCFGHCPSLKMMR